MNRIPAIGLCTALLSITLAGTSRAQQPTVAPPQQRPRGSNQALPLRDVSKAPKQAPQGKGNADVDPVKRQQQQRKKTADAIVDRYVAGFQNNVGLTDDQTQKLSVILGRYIRQRLALAERRVELKNQFKEMANRQAPEEEIQSVNDQLALADKDIARVENAFYNGINPQLTAVQRGKLRFYLEETTQTIGSAIQKSTQPQ